MRSALLRAVAVPDHHLPLRPGPGGAGRADHRRGSPVPQGRAGEVRRGAGAPGRGRHRGVRQDRRAHRRPAQA
ncbi:MAG: hypothetical protein WDM92_07855 [Caulobacteraceae bacterium]